MNIIDATNRHTPSRLQKEMRKILISVRKDYVKKLLVHHQNYLWRRLIQPQERKAPTSIKICQQQNHHETTSNYLANNLNRLKYKDVYYNTTFEIKYNV